MMRYHTPHIHFHLTDWEIQLIEMIEHYDVFIFAIILITVIDFFVAKLF